MGGAVDGGIEVPHSEKRFPGYDKENKEFDAGVLREHIMGVHVGKYMKSLMDDDEDSYKRQFSRFIKLGITGDEMEDLYAKAHEKIRANPKALQKTKKRVTYKERKAGVEQRKAEWLA